MSIERIQQQCDLVWVSLQLSQDHCTAETPHVDEVIVQGDAAELEIETAVRGLGDYLQGTLRAQEAGEVMLAEATQPSRLLLTSPIDRMPMNKVEESVNNVRQRSIELSQTRDEALEEGEAAAQCIERVTAHIRKLSSSAQQGYSQAILVRNQLQEAQNCAAAIDVADQPWNQKIVRAASLAADHARDLMQARGQIYDSRNESGDGVDTSDLPKISRWLKEGLTLLHQTEGQPVSRFTECVKAAYSRISEDDIAYMSALSEAVQKLVSGYKSSIGQRKEVESLATAAQNESTVYRNSFQK